MTLWAEPAQRESPAPEGPFASTDLRGKRVHLVGIGGIGMSGIAQMLQSQGCAVSGCDAKATALTGDLEARGISVAIGHSPAHLDGGADLVVISAAVRDTNPELRQAQQRGVPVLKYAQALGWLMRGRDGIAVSGSHGKTTTTSMIAWALSVAGVDPSVVVGGLVPQLGGNAVHGAEGPFVVEACEFDRSFHNLAPRAAVITNIDRDHLDYYTGGLPELEESFERFAKRVEEDGIVVVNGDDPSAMRATERIGATRETFGEGRECLWRVDRWTRREGRTEFRVLHRGRDFGSYDLLVPGLYNVRNALACIAVCAFFEANRQAVREALGSFRGAKRRFDRIGEAAGVTVMDDYGHHPTEVQVTLAAAREEYPQRRLWCVFQPHQYSRTRMLLPEFAQSFNKADRVIVPDIYAARDSEADRASVHARDLVQELRKNGVEAEYGSELRETLDRLLEVVESGDVVMTMGAGPVDDVAHDLLRELRKRETQHVVVSRL
jgi:UDP-N-acetylmuramate--alanine ligase